MMLTEQGGHDKADTQGEMILGPPTCCPHNEPSFFAMSLDALAGEEKYMQQLSRLTMNGRADVLKWITCSGG